LNELSATFIFRHAKRTTVQLDDVKLLARKSPSLVSNDYFFVTVGLCLLDIDLLWAKLYGISYCPSRIMPHANPLCSVGITQRKITVSGTNHAQACDKEI
jgi:hypothetical protein